MHEYHVKMVNKLPDFQDGVRERGREETSRMLCLLTLLTVTDSYLTATVYVGSIHYGFHYIHQAIIKVHVLWLYRIHIVPGLCFFVTFCWLPYHIDLGRPTKHHKFFLLHRR
jgi:hypothetical protein